MRLSLPLRSEDFLEPAGSSWVRARREDTMVTTIRRHRLVLG